MPASAPTLANWNLLDQLPGNTTTARTSDSVDKSKNKQTREHAEGNRSPVTAEEALNGLDDPGAGGLGGNQRSS